MKGFKGFDKNLQCRGLQYKIGEAVVENEAELCNKGLHFCENPFDVFDYYDITSDNRFAEIEAEDVSNKKSDDSKKVAKKLTIKVEIGLKGMIKAAIAFLFEKSNIKDTELASGYFSKLAASGYFRFLLI